MDEPLWGLSGRDGRRSRCGAVAGPRAPRLLWATCLGDRRLLGWVASGDTIYVAVDGSDPDRDPDRLYALGPGGTVRWSAAVRTIGRVVAATVAGVWVAEDTDLVLRGAADGQAAWRAEGLALDEPTVGTDGTVYLARRKRAGGLLRAIGPDGVARWERAFAAPLLPPTLGPGRWVYAADLAGALDAASPDGVPLWHAEIGEPARWLAPGPDGSVAVRCESGVAILIDAGGRVRWRRALPGLPGPGMALGVGGRLYVVSGDALLAVDPYGADAWALPLPGAGSPPLLAPDGLIVVACADGTVRALAPDGRVAWEHSVDGLADERPAAAPGGLLLVADRGGTLHALGTGGVPAWCYTPRYGGPALDSPLVAGDGTIVVLDEDRVLHALEPDGSRRWSVASRASRDGAAIGPEGVVYVAGGRVLALDLGDGAVRWECTLPTWCSRAPLITRDGDLVLSLRDGSLLALDPSGRERWRAAPGGADTELGTPAECPDGTIVVLATTPLPGVPSRTTLHALGPGGIWRWSCTPEKDQFEGDPAIGSDGTVYLRHGAIRASGLWAVAPGGAVRWRFVAPQDVDRSWPDKLLSDPSVAADGTIYVGGDEYLHAIGQDGALRWRTRPEPEDGPGGAFSGAIIQALCIDCQGTAYAPVAYIRLCAVGSDGHQRWAAELAEEADLVREADFAGGVLMGAAPALGLDGIALIGSFTGCLYALGDSEEGGGHSVLH